jgi:hypothetical protein
VEIEELLDTELCRVWLLEPPAERQILTLRSWKAMRFRILFGVGGWDRDIRRIQWGRESVDMRGQWGGFYNFQG